MRTPPLLLAYGLANAVLYSMILPLWEGFDEPFHFGYVQYLANGRGLPDPRTTPLSREIGLSISAAPASAAVQHNLPQALTYSEYFALPREKRAARLRWLRGIPPEARWQASGIANYEAHHAPLAYVLLAGPERLLAGVALPSRVLVLRIVAAVLGALLFYFAAMRLYGEMGLGDVRRSCAVFCLLSCQMTWATLAHVANDWLAVPLSVLCLGLLVSYWKRPGSRGALWMAVVFSLGLLTKSYFLSLAPLAILVCAMRRRWVDLLVVVGVMFAAAGPWYLRNLLRYGTISGMQEARAGIGMGSEIRAISSIDWAHVAWASFRAGLWTGNNSFTSFSSVTLALIGLCGLVGLIWWARSRHESFEWIGWVFCLLYLAALVYVTAANWVYTHGGSNGPSPWYSQVLLAPLLGFIFLRCPRWIASLLTLLFGYVIVATYVAKLIPLYGGYEGRTSLAGLIRLYFENGSELLAKLGEVTLGPVGAILAVTAVVMVLAILITFSNVSASLSGGTDRR